MKGLFGLVALLITVGIIVYAIAIQLEMFQKRSAGGDDVGVGVGGGVYVTDPDSILAPIDRAEEARRAMEVKSRIPENLIQ